MKFSRKQFFAILVGNGLEYYDFMLFGFFATILAPLYFPHDDPTISRIVSMGSFGIGFIARPLGGVVLGHLGDRWGRKNVLSFSILGLIIPTLIIGLLPYYDSIGIWAPITLIICRFFQGFCLGGESSGAITYLIESTPYNLKDIASAWLVTSCYVGTLVGTLLGSLFMLPFMPTWCWRFTFIIGSIVALLGYYIRAYLKESPEFLKLQKREEILPFPCKTLIMNEKKNLFSAAILASSIVIPFFVIFVYLNSLLVTKLNLEPSLVLFFNASITLLWIIFLPLFGKIAQIIGRNHVMLSGLFGLGVSSPPLFMILESYPTLENILLVQCILSIFSISVAAPISAFLVSLFPVNQRYSGVALGYSLGHALVGGTTPVLIIYLTQSLGYTLAPAIFILTSSLLASTIFINSSMKIWVKRTHLRV